MLLVTQGWGLLPSQYFQTSCSPLLPPVLPFTVCMFLNWQSRQVTLKTSSQNMYWGKRMVESLFFLFICFTTTPQGEQKQTGQKVGDSLACYCFQQASMASISLCYPPSETPWFHCGKIPDFPWDFLPQHWKPGLAAWREHQTQGQAGVPEWTGAHSPWTFLLKHLCLCYFFYSSISSISSIILLPYHWINQLCLKAWKHHVFLFSI